VDEGIIERSENVGNSKDVFTFSDLGAEIDRFFLLFNLFFGRLNRTTLVLHGNA